MQLHHLGYLTPDLSASSQFWIDALGHEPDGDVIHDKGQQARVRLLRHPGQHHWVELIAPDSGESHLNRALQRKVTLHHIAYAVDDLDAAMNQLRSAGSIPLGRPVEGKAFERPIMWFQDPDGGLIELIAPGAGPYQLNP